MTDQELMSAALEEARIAASLGEGSNAPFIHGLFSTFAPV